MADLDGDMDPDAVMGPYDPPIMLNLIPVDGLQSANSSPSEWGHQTYFTATVDFGEYVEFQWDFGEGVASNDANTEFTFHAPITMTKSVTVTAVNPVNSQTSTTIVTLLPAPFNVYAPSIISEE